MLPKVEANPATSMEMGRRGPVKKVHWGLFNGGFLFKLFPTFFWHTFESAIHVMPFLKNWHSGCYFVTIE